MQKRPAAPEVGKLNVCARQCGRCLYGPKPYLEWEDGGKRKIEAALAEERHFTCHEWSNVMCRGFYSEHGYYLDYVRFAARSKLVEFVKREKA